MQFGVIGGSGQGQLSSQRATMFGQQRALPLSAQVTYGTRQATVPARTSAPPLTGMFNFLSQVYDRNITPFDLDLDWRDPRYKSADEAPPQRVGDYLTPDPLSKSLNRYTKIAGVSKDPHTGALLVEYARDDKVDYKNKVYNVVPQSKLGTPNLLLDKLTNTGNTPQERGVMLTLQPRKNKQQTPVSPYAGAFQMRALHDEQMMRFGRTMVNKKQENLAPLQSDARRHDPANTFAPGGLYYMRDMMSRGGTLKVVDPYAAAPAADTRRLSAEGKASPDQYAKSHEMRTFVRDQQAHDLVAASGFAQIQAPAGTPSAQIDGSGMAITQMIAPYSQQSAVPVGAPSAMIDGSGMALTQMLSPYSQQSAVPVGAPGALVDGAGAAQAQLVSGYSQL